MKTVVIDRRKWGRNALKNGAGRFCCLGFCALTAGIPETALKGRMMPSELSNADKFYATFPGLDDDNNGRRYEALLAEVNDSERRKHNKEKLIREYGKQVGINFRFTN